MEKCFNSSPRRHLNRELDNISRWIVKFGFWPICVFFPRISPALLALTCIYSCIRVPANGTALRKVIAWTALIVAYPLLSAFWALSPYRTLTTVATWIAIIIASILVFQRSELLKQIFRPSIAYGVPIIIFTNLADISLGIPLRLLSSQLGINWIGQPITVGKLGFVLPDAVNWSVTIMTLCFFPYLYATRKKDAEHYGLSILHFVISIALIAAIFLSPHETSKAAITAGIIAYTLAFFRNGPALALVTIGWMISIAATPIIMKAALPQAKEVAPFVQPSLQHRFLIWNEAVREISRNPIIGTGVGSTRVDFREKRRSEVAPPLSIAAHSHNCFLDLWRELGAIGAALAIIGVTLVSQRLFASINTVPPELTAFLALILIMSTASFSLWQPWYLSAIGLSAAVFGMSASRSV